MRLSDLRWDNLYARLGPPFAVPAVPTPLAGPRLAAWDPDAAALLELDPAEALRPEWMEILNGERLLPGAEPVAMLYAGHQFGSYVPQLGDGRALLLGTVRNGAGDPWDLQLKGSGPTSFSRGFDGRAVLRSTIREFLGGAAMHGLGIPTTRALCLLDSDTPVQREVVERGALLLRMAPSHIRFGSFEVFFYRGQHEHLRTLADYTIGNFFPELAGEADRYARFLREVAVRTARLIARWQEVGFAHGVMNTDNFSVLGLTLDYGPFGFLDDYDPGFIPNHTDVGGRYAFDRQPGVGLWNVACLAQALLPLLSEREAHDALDAYEPAFSEHLLERMRAKLGLREARPEDGGLIADLLGLLQANRVDYTGFFRALGDFRQEPGEANAPLRDRFPNWAAWGAWADAYRARLELEGSTDAPRKRRMDRVNPRYVLRNYLAQEAIERAERERDYSGIERLLGVLRDPFTDRPGMERYAEPPPEWGRRLVVNCSS